MTDIKEQIRINILEMENASLHLEGDYYQPLDEDDYSIVAISDGQIIEPLIHDVDQIQAFDEEGNKTHGGAVFSFDLPLKPGRSYRICLRDHNGSDLKKPIGYGRRTKLSTLVKGSYYASGEFLIKGKGNTISVYSNTFIAHLKAELRFLRGMKLKSAMRAIAYRWPAMIRRKLKRKPVWIVSDRTTVAGDNGEALFRYIMGLPDREADVYFLLDKDSRDFGKMQSIGKVLVPDSYKYRLKFLCADIIISSQADRWTVDAFRKTLFMVKDLYTFKYAFLQHGITKDDVSRWLWKQNRGIDLFVTAGKKEYESIVNGNYDYTEKEIKLTGFPRFDRLESDPQKKIYILPTWRRNLAADIIPGKSERPYSEEFKNSDYCIFYNKLINDKRLLEAMRLKGYTGEFYIHPSSSNQARDFKGNDIIEAKNEGADYNRVFREGSLIVTDFSSVAFDFAYLKKPIVYSQFDRDTFFEGHIYKQGYFSYEENGFGPVCVDYEDIIDTIIAYLENDCVMEEKFKNRVDEFFAYSDKNNCERVYRELLKM